MQMLQDLKARQEYLRAKPEKQAFPGELEAFDTVLGWVTSFVEKLESQNAGTITHSLVQLGLDNPHFPDHFGDMDCGEPINTWFRGYQWQYNTAIWEAIVSRDGLIQKLRRVLLADLRATSDLGPDWGKIVLHAYAQAFLDCFLQPKAPAWCITKHWQTPELLERLKVKPKISA